MRLSLLTLVPLATIATAFSLDGVHAERDIEIARSARSHFEKRGFGEAEHNLNQAGREIIDGFKDVGAGIGYKVTQSGKEVKDAVVETVDGVKQVGDEVKTKVVTAADSAINSVMKEVEKGVDGVKQVRDEVATAAERAKNSTLTKVKEGVDGVKQVRDEVATAAERAKNSTLTKVEEGVNDVKELGCEVDKKVDVATGAVAGVKERAGDAIQDSEKIISDAADTISGKTDHRKLEKRFIFTTLGSAFGKLFGRKAAKEGAEEGVKQTFKKTKTDKLIVVGAGATIGAGGLLLGGKLVSAKPDPIPEVANGETQVVSFRTPSPK